jgi:hypothetical protein
MGNYEILGIDASATQQDIKNAYRRKAFELHPDRNPAADASERFCEIQNAYEALTAAPTSKPTQKQTRPTNDWIKDAPPPTHDLWGKPLDREEEVFVRSYEAPIRRQVTKDVPEVDLWKSTKTKSQILMENYWKEYDRLKISMAYEEPDKFWDALDEWSQANR